MYEIYINDRPLRLIDQIPQSNLATSLATHLVARYTGKVKTLLHYADLLEKGSPKVKMVTLVYPDLEKLWSDFQSHYKIVEAAGGFVNLQGTDKYLYIYRRGFLDLPKGKIDKGETPKQAAIREVCEETGLALKQLSIRQLRSSKATGLPNYRTTELRDYHTTYHTYRNRKGKRVLKPTYWYPMVTTQMQLIPQVEEDIEWVKWLTHEEVTALNLKTFKSLAAPVDLLIET